MCTCSTSCRSTEQALVGLFSADAGISCSPCYLQTVLLRKRPPWKPWTADLHLDAPIIGFTWPSNSAFLTNWCQAEARGSAVLRKVRNMDRFGPWYVRAPTLTHPLSVQSSAMHPDIQNFPKSRLHSRGQLITVTLQRFVATGINAQQSSSRLLA